MKIALVGYGKMGKEIEKIAIERGHSIVLTIDINNQQDFTVENLKKADVVIEFTTPATAYNNYLQCFKAGVPVVSGSTGWTDKFDEIASICKETGNTFFYASNYSLGVNIFFELNKKLAAIMNKFPQYDVCVEEAHHNQKLDAPSGTAVPTPAPVAWLSISCSLISSTTFFTSLSLIFLFPLFIIFM